MTILIFTLVSLITLLLAGKKPTIFLVQIISSFFFYYFALTLFGVDLQPGESLFVYLFFYGVVFIYLLMAMKAVPTINKLDSFYLFFCLAWICYYLINFDHKLFFHNKVYRQAPVFMSFTFIVPLILKPTFENVSMQRLLKYLEYTGFGASVLVLTMLLMGLPSKDVWISTEKIDWLRYAPVRGFFSNRQALLFASSIIIFVSRACYMGTTTKELLWKIPLTIISIAGIIVSGSRGILITSIMICIYLLLTKLSLMQKFKAGVAGALIVVALLSFFGTEQYAVWTERALNIESYQSNETGLGVRYTRYQTGLEHFFERPFWGTGMSMMSAKYDYSHNIFISILEDTGLLGLIWLLSFLLFLVLRVNWNPQNRVECGVQLTTRNLLLFLFLVSNMYGSVISHAALFLLLGLYYFKYRTRSHLVSLDKRN